MKTYRYIILSITAIFISVLHGCNPAAYSIFSEPAESEEKNVTLVLAGHNQPNTVVGIERIDKEQLSDTVYENKTKYKLAPGRHTVFYYFVSQKRNLVISSQDFNISFLAKAGHNYILKSYSQWDTTSPKKYMSVDSLTMITDATEGEVVAWDSRGTGAFKKELQSQTGLKFTEETDKNAVKANDFKEASAVCGNDYCEQNEIHSGCPADCFPEDIKPIYLPMGDKAVFLDFVYKGQKSGIYFVVNRGVHEKLAALPRSLSHKSGKVKITKIDFILPKLNNKLQKEKLLPLVEKIK